MLSTLVGLLDPMFEDIEVKKNHAPTSKINAM
jgi:hypothetical protein